MEFIYYYFFPCALRFIGHCRPHLHSYTGFTFNKSLPYINKFYTMCLCLSFVAMAQTILFVFFISQKFVERIEKKNMILYTNKMELKTKITINICIITITNSSNNKAIKLFDKCKTTMMLNAALPNFIVATRIATHFGVAATDHIELCIALRIPPLRFI